MNQPTFAEFETQARAAGFDEVLERCWAPDAVIATHTHPFAVDALVTQGEMWLACEGRSQHLRPAAVVLERDAAAAQHHQGADVGQRLGLHLQASEDAGIEGLLVWRGL